METPQHLEPEVVEVLTLPREERVQFAEKDHWVGHTQSKKFFKAAEDLLAYPKTIRMPNLLIVADSDNGKSTLVQRFGYKLHPPTMLPEGDPFVPAVVVAMPPDPTESRFWSSVLYALGVAYQDSDSAHLKATQAQEVLEAYKTRMLMVDETNNLAQSKPRDQRVVLATIKNLGSRLKIPIVASGTREAISAMHSDTQLASRFDVFPVPLWNLDMEFLRFLASYERLLPLAEPSNLKSQELAKKIYSLSNGTVGGIVKAIKKATVLAIRAGKEKIDKKIIDEVQFVPLRDYGKQVTMV